jgi:2,5-diamino-6-(ribosylamino)-4(3H)-pyrimidinone 5'-phosphate reductase
VPSVDDEQHRNRLTGAVSRSYGAVMGSGDLRVVVHVAVGLDGTTRGFAPDLGTFYGLVSTWSEDVTLTGADTILAQEDALRAAESLPGPSPDGPLLAVVDSRRRVTVWEELRTAGLWRDVRRLGAPPGQRVDLRSALQGFAAEGARTVRVDSGGALTGALLAARLVDECSLLVHPALGEGAPWTGGANVGTGFRLVHDQRLAEGLVWLRYAVT